MGLCHPPDSRMVAGFSVGSTGISAIFGRFPRSRSTGETPEERLNRAFWRFLSVDAFGQLSLREPRSVPRMPEAPFVNRLSEPTEGPNCCRA